MQIQGCEFESGMRMLRRSTLHLHQAQLCVITGVQKRTLGQTSVFARYYVTRSMYKLVLRVAHVWLYLATMLVLTDILRLTTTTIERNFNLLILRYWLFGSLMLDSSLMKCDPLVTDQKLIWLVISLWTSCHDPNKWAWWPISSFEGIHDTRSMYTFVLNNRHWGDSMRQRIF